ncbi:hypothetical protein [Pontiella agarivorans]|uniref:Uncharacterized protein n=1 Tax=Pontiella agarivorans TaxID=3038953 RepID=A0ABU5MTZ7_9BACT|nr:hypothetical protein [Pontiella agarivorans]MDZ8117617.1 hypothetical protein [Pontiella agarivorans]
MNKYHLVSAVLFSVSMVWGETSLFSEKGGFQSGNLNGQQGWISEAGYIDTDAEAFILSPDIWKSSFCGDTVNMLKNTSCTVSADFSFTVSGKGGSDIFSLLVNNQPKGAGCLRGLFARTPRSDKYKFGFKTTENKLYLSDPVPAAKMGLANSDVSDRLIMNMTMKKGETSAGWKIQVELLNARTGALLSKLTESDIKLSDSFFSADLYGGFSSSRGDSETGTCNRSVHLFSFDGDQDTATLSFIL